MGYRVSLYLGITALALCPFGQLQGQRAVPEPFENAPAESVELKNPYEGNADHARAGAKLFRQSCASCHGADAAGKGKYPSLRTEKTREATPGALFWFIRTGSPKKGMPSFNRLPEQRIWQIITFLQAEPVAAH